jgi:hypothetical protein
MRKKISPYRQGAINTEEHPILKKGQIVEIVDENEEFFRVRVFLTGKIESIKKIHISLN